MGMDKMMETFASLKETATVEKVFGPPQTMGDRTIIPVAEVMYKFGGGFGKGKGPAAAPGEGEGEGGGGGGAVRARPVAVLEVTPAGLCVIPIRDVTRLALSAMMLGAATICMTGRMIAKAMAHHHHHHD